MSAYYLLMLVCGAAAGGFLSGLAGFGTALFALGFWLQVMTPPEAVSLAVVMAVVSGIPGVWMLRETISTHRIRLARFVIPGLIGAPIGVVLLAHIDAGLLKLVIAGFLILYGGFFTVRKNLPKMTARTPIIDASIGFVGGILGGSTGLSGALPTMWCAMRPWPKEETRAVTQPYNVLALLFAAILMAFYGVFDKAGLLRILIAIPVTVLSAYVGMYIFRRLQDDHFRRLLIGLMFLAGIIISARELL